jgi:CBS domain-containing protein
MNIGYKVGDIMTQNPVSVSSEHSLHNLSQEMSKYKVNAVLVADKKKKELHGIITEQDIVRKTIAIGKNPLDLKASDIMEKNLITITPEKDIQSAIKIMGEMNIRHLPVVEEGEFVGLLTLNDIVRIQPQLIEMISHRLHVREEDLKPLRLLEEGICEFCGEYTPQLINKDGSMLCKNCKD